MVWKSGSYSDIPMAPNDSPTTPRSKFKSGKYCTGCGKKLGVDNIFCPKCGKKIEAKKPNKNQCVCGQILGLDECYCRSCGRKKA